MQIYFDKQPIACACNAKVKNSSIGVLKQFSYIWPSIISFHPKNQKHETSHDKKFRHTRG